MALFCKRVFSITLTNNRKFVSSSQLWKDSVRVRFAPSPTGQLHLGSLRTALYNYCFAKKNGGKFILRIEDTDQKRLVPGATDKLIEVLNWTGIIPDEGPDHGGDYGPYVQSLRLDIYEKHYQQLLQSGAAYRCFCTDMRLNLLKKDAFRRNEVPGYDNKCRHLTAEEIQDKLNKNTPYVIRLKMTDPLEVWDDIVYGTIEMPCLDGDPVIIKTDKYPTYHFANVVDDHTMNITHVIRGNEWQTSTPKHLQLYKAFGWKLPEFAHIPLIIGSDGTKLSKRHGDVHVTNYQSSGRNAKKDTADQVLSKHILETKLAIAWNVFYNQDTLRANGYHPKVVINFVTSVGGGFGRDGGAELMDLNTLVAKFELTKLTRHEGRLDPMELRNYNKVYLKEALKNEKELKHVTEHVRQLVIDAYDLKKANEDVLLTDGNIASILQWSLKDRIKQPTDLLDEQFDFLWTEKNVCIDELQAIYKDFPTVIKCAIEVINTMENTSDLDLTEKSLKQAAKNNKISAGKFMTVLRNCFSNCKNGPRVVEMIEIMGKTEALKRLNKIQNENVKLKEN